MLRIISKTDLKYHRLHIYTSLNRVGGFSQTLAHDWTELAGRAISNMAATNKTKSPLPAAGKSFYIDEVDLSKSRLQQLEKSLRLLGAKLEKFFTKDIYCLVTDHGQPSDYLSRSQGSDNKSASTPSPFGCTPGSNAAVPSDAGSSSTKNSTSRAARMLMKSQQKNNRQSGGNSISISEQLVRNARQWSIKIISTETAQQWADKKISAHKLNQKPRKTRERSERTPKVKGKVLKAPFIKIEEKSGSYKPIYRQLTSDAVPVLNTDADNCPFAAAAPAASENTDAVEEKIADTALNTSKVEGDKRGKGKRLAKVKAAAPPAKPVKKKLTFCMACKVGYDDLDQHLRSDQHRKYAEDNNNYKAVDELISQNANMQRFLDDIMKYHPVHKEEGLAQQKEITSSASTSSMHNGELDAPPLSPLELVHRSVSDSGESEENLTILPLGDQGSLGTRGSLPSMVQQSERVDGEVNGNDEKPMTADKYIEQVEVAPAEEIQPNVSKVVVQLKIKPSSKKSSPEKNHLKSSPSGKLKNAKTGVDNSNISDSDLFSSEIVKVKKRGKSNLNKKPAVTQKTKPMKDKRSSSSIADTQAHWALLSSQGHEKKAVAALPVDVCYGTLDEQQLETMASQRQSLGVSDVDNVSLVQSIHSLLQDTFSPSQDEPADVHDVDPFLSCDNYISNKLSSAGQSNMMLQPVTPRKSPRVSLGARDLHDEHFSPEKRRLSQNMEKTRRNSEDLDTGRRRISKFDLARSMSLPAPVVEDKENMSCVEIQCQTAASLCASAADDTSVTSSRQTIISPDISTVEDQPPSQLISTPLPDLQRLDTSVAIISSTPTADKVKKSLFTSPSKNSQKSNPASAKPPATPNTSRACRKRRRRKWSSQITTAGPIYADCFGFEENVNSNNNNVSGGLLSSRSPKTRQPQFARKYSITHSKADYDRQNSLLSFGSESLTQFEDVFGQPPNSATPMCTSAHKKSPRKRIVRCSRVATTTPLRRSPRRKHDYFGFSDDDLSSPGFKLSLKVRKAAKIAQKKIQDTETSPKRRKYAQMEQNDSPRTTRQHTTISGASALESDGMSLRSKTKLCSPARGSPTKRFRSGENPLLSSPCSTTYSRPGTSPKASKKRPATPTCDDVQYHRSVSMCTSQAPSDSLDISQQQDDSTDCKSVVSSASHRSLPDSAADYIIKHKYAYNIGSRPNRGKELTLTNSQDI